MINWTLVGWVWVIGWLLATLTFSAALRATALDRRTRSDTAQIRALWNDRQNRTRIVFAFLFTWPLILITNIVALCLMPLIAWIDKKEAEERARE